MDALAGAEFALLIVGSLALLVCTILIAVLAKMAWGSRQTVLHMQEKLQEFGALDDALSEERRAEEAARTLQTRIDDLEHQRSVLDHDLMARKKEMASVEDAISMQEFGVYRPKYDFDSADEYSARLSEVRQQLKEQIKGGTACVCTTEWRVHGSRKEGERMTKKQIKLMLRAFNGEADAAISRVKYSNADAMEKRIDRAYSAINKLGESNKTQIQPGYLALKLAELELVHEHAVKKQEEKEAAREAAARLREEEKAAKEIAKIQKDAEKEEKVKQKALDKARAELAALHGHALEAQQEQATRLETAVTKLESELQAALDRKAKAIARAQLTRSGWVYVLSNIGSFGEGVFKIGLTRRFDPLERVKELGSASVPFLFDVHAMVFTEDAPALESALHTRFNERRVNLVNRRKEYFRVSLEEIQEAFAELHGPVSFVLEAAAPQYWETTAMLRAQAE